MENNIILVENAVKAFKNNLALDHVSVKFAKGAIHGIIGRNGSGKTVLFKCICGFMRLTSGQILVNGKTIGKQINIPKNIGIIIETPGFLQSYSGYKNLKMLASIQHKIEKNDIKNIMTRVGLDPENKKKVGKYSLGMKQRLGIAQAIMENPDILILDEPMNGLDIQGVKDIKQLLLQLKQEGKTIILASHNMEDIHDLCDTVHEMSSGKILLI